jgi:hypothetical protein
MEIRMLSWPVPSWIPAATDREDKTPASGPFDLSAAFETQARLWNHLLDANRSLWALYAPWMPAAWNLGNAAEPVRALEQGIEPTKTADGVPDALESQTRLWNQLVDANRSFWSAVTWSVPGAPWLPAGDEQAAAANDETAAPEPASRHAKAAAARKKTATRSR